VPGEVGQRPQGGRAHLGDPGDVVEVHDVDQVTELHTVDHLNVPVLVVEVLPRLGSNPRPVAAKPVSAVDALAGAARVSMGAATAVTAEADRNVRRVEPLDPKTRLFSIA
jgi:hypothetical protein